MVYQVRGFDFPKECTTVYDYKKEMFETGEKLKLFPRKFQPQPAFQSRHNQLSLKRGSQKVQRRSISMLGLVYGPKYCELVKGDDKKCEYRERWNLMQH